tara:strand:- start:10 stop:369 length:360 start_codon:yes stop_codon:yes gene_type:complete
MNKIDLEERVESLRKMVLESQKDTSNYTGQLTEIEKKLADLNKPELTSSQMDDIFVAIEAGIEQFDWNDTDNFEIEYGISYDGRVECETHEFRNSDDLARMICDKVSRLFKETEEKEDK